MSGARRRLSRSLGSSSSGLLLLGPGGPPGGSPGGPLGGPPGGPWGGPPGGPGGGYRFLRDLVDHDFLRHFDPDFDDYLETCLTLRLTTLDRQVGHQVALFDDCLAHDVRCFPELHSEVASHQVGVSSNPDLTNSIVDLLDEDVDEVE